MGQRRRSSRCSVTCVLAVWFDGLAKGRVGQQRWSNVLSSLLNRPSARFEAAGIDGTAVRDALTAEIEADNTFDLSDLWSGSPCSVFITPEGDWVAGPGDDTGPPLPGHLGSAMGDQEWADTRTKLLSRYDGSKAVAWDLSWFFISSPGNSPRHTKVVGAWGAHNHASVTSTSSWAARVSSARRALASRAPA